MKLPNNFVYICLFAFCALFACQKETDTSKIDDPIPCVGPEIITDTTSGFLIFEKGANHIGYVNGTKINQTFEGLPQLILFDTTFNLVVYTFWPDFDGDEVVAEVIAFNRIPYILDENCINLTNNRNFKTDSIFVSYNVVNDDVGILAYELDTTADNKLEIISFDKEAKKLKARFKASFIGEKEYLPDLPKHVRFVDTYIEIGY